jgi:hypothetical protein
MGEGVQSISLPPPGYSGNPSGYDRVELYYLIFEKIGDKKPIKVLIKNLKLSANLCDATGCLIMK